MKRISDLIDLEDERAKRLPESSVASPRDFQRAALATFTKQKSKIMRLYQLVTELTTLVGANQNRIEALEKRVGELANEGKSGRRIVLPGE